MSPDFNPADRRMGVASAAGVVVLGVGYLVCLVIGLASLTSPQEPIGDPWFTALEILILAMMPPMVTLMISVHVRAPAGRKAQGMAAVVFMALVAVITSAVHFSILTLSRKDSFVDMQWLFSFTWPSVAYALDILAWDLFFPLSVLFARSAFVGGGLERGIRILLGVSGALALAGLAGAFLDHMGVRNIGILGYAVVFPLAAALMGIVFWKEERAQGPIPLSGMGEA